ncbi:MAG: exported protein of unknown function [Rhodospirillales bacterium]|nr:exported protein of unknown function [Rhodospirillales bacterium]
MSVSNPRFSTPVPANDIEPAERRAKPASRRRIAKEGLPLILSLIAALGISYVLVPRGQEMALLRLESGDAAGAREVLEQRYADGETSPAIIAALARARALTGDLPGAVALLEPLARERPQDLVVINALVTYRRADGRDQAGLLRAVTMLQAVQPSVPRMREIAILHGMLGQRDEQRAALHRLLAAETGDVADYLMLARLEAGAGAPAAGIAALQRLAREHPRAVDEHVVALAVSLHVQAGHPEEALAAAGSWLAQQDADVAAMTAPTLASILGPAERPDLVVALLAPWAGPTAPAGLILALAQAEIDAGRAEAALTRLEALPLGVAAEALEVRLLRLRLAVALAEFERAIEAASLLGASDVSDPLIAALSMAAMDTGRPDLLRRLLGWGGPELLRADPALAAEAALLLDDEDAARRWSAMVPATSAAAGLPVRALGFARVLFHTGQEERGLAAFAQLLTRPDLTPDMLAEIARGYLGASRAEEGAMLLNRRRQEIASAAADAAWALVAAAVPTQQAVVVEWLATATDLAPFPGFLPDLTHVAADAGANDLAIAAARHLVLREDRDDVQMLLAHLLIDAGRPSDALDPLGVLRGRGADVAALHEAALTAAWRQGAPVGDALRALWSERVQAAQTPEARSAAMAMLVAFGGERETLPVLRRLATDEPARWLWSYTAAADTRGAAWEATALWAALSLRPDLPVEFRRPMAFGLLERGARPAAIDAFRELAATAAPDSADVRQLLFLWGLRPPPAAIAWIEARARRADGAEIAVWMRLLIERGAAGRAVAAYRAVPRGGAPGPARDVFLTALSVVGDRTGLAAAVREELRPDIPVGRLRLLAGLAGQSGDAALEEQVFRAMVMAGDRNPQMLRRVGLIAFRDGQFAQAERWLSEGVSGNGADAQAYFTLGEIRLRQRDPAGAQPHFEAALRRLDQSGDTSVQARKLRATLLRRLGRGREALPVYEALLAAAPSDSHLRADLVSLLMELRDYRNASLVLAAR